MKFWLFDLFAKKTEPIPELPTRYVVNAPGTPFDGQHGTVAMRSRGGWTALELDKGTLLYVIGRGSSLSLEGVTWVEGELVEETEDWR